jgi:glutamine cyclotransferase
LSPKPQQKRSFTKYLWLAITVLIIAGAFYGIYKLDWIKAPEQDVSVPGTLAELMTYEVVQAYPHDPGSFTQGLTCPVCISPRA